MTTKGQYWEAKRALQAGDRAAARSILAQLVQTEPDYADAWLLLFSAADDPSEKYAALKQVARIRPDDPTAREKLRKYKASAEYRAVKAGQYTAKKQAEAKNRTERKRQEVAASRRSFFQETLSGVRRLFDSVKGYLRDRF